MVAEDDDPWSAKRSGFQRSRSLDVTMMDTLSKYGGGSQSGYVHTLESGINVASWIIVAPGKFGKKNKRSPIYTLYLYY